MSRRRFLSLAALILGSMMAGPAEGRDDPLPSWNEGASKRALLQFVGRVTTEGSPDFVPVADRIATFDNDGTLWSEQPVYTQTVFSIARVQALAGQHPEWKDRPLFKAAIEGDVKPILAGTARDRFEMLATANAGMTPEEFDRIVKEWLATARHPRFDRPYTELVYQPMLELLSFLRANAFKTFIVSGGGVEFMRPWSERVYGIPSEQVVGSLVRTKYELRDGVPVLVRLPEVAFIDDKAGKPEGIERAIGRRPIAAFGNSDGDYEMLRWTSAGTGPRLGLIVHHTDAAREWAYDRQSPVGRLVRALDEAPERGWIVVNMKEDWKVIYPSSETRP